MARASDGFANLTGCWPRQARGSLSLCCTSAQKSSRAASRSKLTILAEIGRSASQTSKNAKFWGDYVRAYEAAIDKTNALSAPWFVVPSEHKWFCDLVVSTVLAQTLEDMKIQMPKPKVDLDAIETR
jgi:hypothetical protein